MGKAKISEINEIITNYSVINNKIRVWFEDETYYEIPYSKENEQNVIKVMVSQANERIDKKELKRVNKKIRYMKDLKTIKYILSTACFFITMILSLWVSSCNTCTIKLGNINGIQIFGFGFAVLITINFIFDIVYNSIIEKLNEAKQKQERIRKYKIYLKNVDNFARASENTLFNNVQRKSNSVNINNIDLYSLDEVEKMLNNILRNDILEFDFKVSNIKEEISNTNINIKQGGHNEKRKQKTKNYNKRK